MKKKIQLIKDSKFIILSIRCLLLTFHPFVFAINPIDQSLFSAALSGSTQQVEQAIFEGANVNSVDENSDSALSLAVKNGYFDVVQLLVKKGSKVDYQSDKNKTLLHLAAQNGYVEIARFLLKIKHDLINAKSERGETPLHLAAQYGRIEVVQLLLAQNANVNAVDNKYHMTPLHWAALQGHSEAVKLLLDYGTNKEDLDHMISARNKKGKTPLHLAAQNGHTEVVRLLLAQNANANPKDEEDVTPLHLAAYNGHSEVMKLLLDYAANKEDLDHMLNAKSKRAETPLYFAAYNGHTEVVRLLLAQNAHANGVENQYSTSALHAAALNGHSEIVKLLLDYGANKKVLEHMINNYNNKGETPLHLAAQYGRTEVVRLLLTQKEKINVNAVDNKYHMTPLHWAALQGHSEAVKLLLDYGTNKEDLDHMLNARNKKGETPLHLAVQNGRTEIVRLLLKQKEKINVNAKDEEEHMTPLHWAALNGDHEILKLLLDHGANKEASNSKKETALHQAVEKGHSEIIQALLEKGAQVHVLNVDNRTPLNYAFSFSVVNTIAYGQVRVEGINIDRMNILIKLLLWHNYQSSSPRIDTYESSIYKSIKDLIRQIEAINPRDLPADQKKYFDQAENLIRWIFNETSNCLSKKDFLAKILKYLLESNPTEQQDLLKENIKHLLLKNYLLNKENSDFYNLKSTFSSLQLAKLKELENFLRDTYAKQLKKELFNNVSKEDLENELNALEKKDHDLSALGKITNVHKINNPVIQYCNDSSIDMPLKDNILEMHRANRINALLEWMQQLNVSTPMSLPDENIFKKDTKHKSSWSKWGRSYLTNFQQKMYDLYNYLNSITIENRSITPLIQWIQQHYNNRFLGFAPNDLPKKELSSKAIWSKWGVSYLEDSTRLLANIYNHLDYIIEHEGAQINSDTPFGRNKIDILEFEKQKATEAHNIK